MKRKEILSLVVETLRSIQEMNGKEVTDINEDTVPIDQLPGFDSLTGEEFAIMVGNYIPIPKTAKLCVSDDENKAMSVKQIVDRLMDFYRNSQQGGKNGQE